MAKTAKTVAVKRDKVTPPGWSEGAFPMRFFPEAYEMFDRLFEAPAFGRGAPFGALGDWRRWQEGVPNPTMDVVESENAYELTAELPGMDEKDVELVLNDRTLTLKGEKKEESEKQEKDYRLSERRFGSFQRSFVVPDGVDTGKVSARFAKGVLHIILPKSKEAQLRQRKIPVDKG